MYVSLPTDSAQMHNESYQHILIPFRKMLMCITLLLCYGKEFLIFVCKGTQILLIIPYKQTFFFAAEEVLFPICSNTYLLNILMSWFHLGLLIPKILITDIVMIYTSCFTSVGFFFSRFFTKYLTKSVKKGL